jgi:hypothetical protein
MCSINFPHPKIVPFYEIMWKNMVQPDRSQVTDVNMHAGKNTDTHAEYVTPIAFPLQETLDERASVLRYTYFNCTHFFLLITSYFDDVFCCWLFRSIEESSNLYSFKYIQQDATLYNIVYCCQCSTCFRRFLRPSSGARTVHTASGICPAFLLLPLAWMSWHCVQCQLTVVFTV